jgi:hypothetical protein
MPRGQKKKLKKKNVDMAVTEILRQESFQKSCVTPRNFMKFREFLQLEFTILPVGGLVVNGILESRKRTYLSNIFGDKLILK